MTDRTCSIEDCEKPAKTRGWCSMHAARFYRHGDPLVLLTNGTAETIGSHGYVTVTAQGHPLADQRGRAYLHRLRLWDKIGPGEHPCTWCQSPVSWFAEARACALVVDHLDTDRRNNTPENLVPSCGACNVVRTGRYKLQWTHCPNGHEYTPENQEPSIRTHRKCRECASARRRRYVERKRAERA